MSFRKYQNPKIALSKSWIFFLVFLAACSMNPTPDGSLIDVNRKSLQSNNIYTKVLHAHYLSFSGKQKAALQLFQKMIEENPDNGALHYQYSRFLIDLAYRCHDPLIQEKHFREAQSSLEKAIRLPGNRIKEMKALADISMELSEFEKSVEILTQLHKEFPEDLNITVSLARILIHLEQSNKAYQMLKPLVNSDEESDLNVLKVFALACGESGRLMEAITNYEIYLNQVHDDYEISYNYALCLYRTSQHEKAESVLAGIMQNGSVSIEAAELLVDVLRAQKKYERAVLELLQLAEIPQFEVGAYIEIGQILLGLGDYASAQDYFLKAIVKDPNSKRATFYSAVALKEMGKFPEALRMLENNLEARPLSVTVVNLATDILVEKGDYNTALLLSSKLISEVKDDPRVFLIHGQVLAQLSEIEKSQDTLAEGIRLFPENRSLKYALAYSLEQNGQWQKAVKIFERLWESSQNDPEIANFIGYTLADHDADLDRALELIKFAVSKQPDNPAYIDSLGWVLFKRKQYNEAFEYLSQARESMPNDAIVLLHNIEVLIALEQYERADELLQEAIRNHPANRTFRQLKSFVEKKQNESQDH